ncbi:MAG: phosphoribosylformylglycinamidine synthase [Bacteroidales bacterium]|nr:phosphoribosylformylglycinamidine synthase [Bacteroidales bacterium]
MTNGVRRLYVEKKQPYAVRAQELHEELQNYLGIRPEQTRVLIRYDVENVSDKTYELAKQTVFAEPPVDNVYEEAFPHGEEDFCFTVEYLPGQFDQRADSAEQCVKLLCNTEEPIIRSATTYVVVGKLSEAQREAVVHHCINPVDSRLAAESKPTTLSEQFDEPADVALLTGFQTMAEEPLRQLYDSLGLAMTFADFQHIQRYFHDEEHRDPSMTEIRVLDTYWSDHCRHTTFATELKDIHFDEGYYRPLIEGAFRRYLADHAEQYAGRTDKYVCLMDIGTLAAKRLRKQGLLADQEVSDEINACSIVVPVVITAPDGTQSSEEWLVNFKNETHNHPTEIEPFGGAATCLGGCIRDPLSGRTYVYQAMRVTGAADPTRPLSKTLPGKLPQRKITTTAARGYSSYGNQIGLATGLVSEVYHPNYVAKRMEIGAVIAAAPRRQVKRLTSDPGDVIILLGGRTGRDGCGGATGSSKSHTTASLTTCGAEVQKGNAPTERKIQRLFRREEVSSLIKKCNDFGAGGVSVAIGELADGLHINLDKVPKKYAGLDGTELAISESQERMAVVVDPKDVDAMLRYADEENLEATVVAYVTEEPRMVITWRGREIVNLSRRFIDTNGAHQQASVSVRMPEQPMDTQPDGDVKSLWLSILSDLNVCSQKGLVEMFDSSIGAGSVVMPFGGRHQLTPTQSMIGKLPLLEGRCDTVTIMSYGLDPYLMSWSPFHGAVWNVVNSVAKIAAAGGDVSRVRLTFQEYFKKLGTDAYRWGEPFSALLGAYSAQMGLLLPSIGGKDSMSGTFNDIDVPPTLCSFAVGVGDIRHVVTPELKQAGSRLVLLDVRRAQGTDGRDYGMPDYEDVLSQYAALHRAVQDGQVLSAYVVGFGGLVEAVSKMAFGNKLGVQFTADLTAAELVAKNYGHIVVETASPVEALPFRAVELGVVTEQPCFVVGGAKIDMEEALQAWTSRLESVFPTRTASAAQSQSHQPVHFELKDYADIHICQHKTARPRVFIPTFPGTNCEYDSARAFLRAGAEVQTLVFRNQNGHQIEESVRAYAEAIENSQIVMLPGGFSAGDEPEGSAKFITSVFRNARISDAVMRLLRQRDGLMLGICNGFQALVKLGLVPYGEIRPQAADAPTLTFNTIGRHQSKMAHTAVVSNLSPWLRGAELGKDYVIPISHGEGRFVAPQEWIDRLFANGQVATQYVDLNGQPTMDDEYNMNGSYCAIEGITSPDGRVLGKMGHSERRSAFQADMPDGSKRRVGTAMNIYGCDDQLLFESGVAYFK